jgi:hypothetical protein
LAFLCGVTRRSDDIPLSSVFSGVSLPPPPPIEAISKALGVLRRSFLPALVRTPVSSSSALPLGLSLDSLNKQGGTVDGRSTGLSSPYFL